MPRPKTERVSHFIACRLPPIDQQRLMKIVNAGYYLNASDFMREAVREKLDRFEASPSVNKGEEK